jgi:hypothetical protein
LRENTGDVKEQQTGERNGAKLRYWILRKGAVKEQEIEKGEE